VRRSPRRRVALRPAVIRARAASRPKSRMGPDDSAPTELAPTVADSEPPSRDGRSLADGAQLGRYVIRGVLGRGGMGVVYRAFDPELGRPVALKIVRPGDDERAAESRKRLVAEAKAMARIAHPNVIVVHDAGVVDDQVYVAMELVDGASLDTWTSAQPRTWREIVDAYRQAARGLAAAHAAGLVHRDFKPANALVGNDGRVRVLDFGIARSLDEPAFDLEATPATALRVSRPAITQTGAVLGTPRFMSPEQWAGERTDARSDQFSFCIALYHALYGAYPFTGESIAELAIATSEGRIAQPPRGTRVPRFVYRVLERGLAPRPADRFPTMDALRNAIRGGLRTRFTVKLAAPTLLVLSVTVTAGILFARTTARRNQANRALAFSQHQERVTIDNTKRTSPALSPDGRTLAYATRDGIAFRELATGQVREIVDSRAPEVVRWSPNGDAVAATTDHGPIVMSTRGTSRLIKHPGSECTVAWSPDGRELLWQCDDEDDMAIIEVATGSERAWHAALPQTHAVIDFDWNARGVAIATRFNGNGALWLAQPDQPAVVHVADDRRITSVRWNAAGTRLYYSRPAQNGFEIAYRDIGHDGEATVALAQPEAEIDHPPLFDISADERTLFFRLETTWSEAISVSLDGGAPSPLTLDRQLISALSISPDGTRAVFATGPTLVSQHPFVVTLGASSEPLPLAPANLAASAWSPRGDEVAILAFVSDVSELSVTSLASHHTRTLPVGPLDYTALEWLRDGSILALARDRHNVVVIDPATGAHEKLWPTDRAESYRFLAASHDGAWIATSEEFAANSARLVKVSRATGEVVELAPYTGRTAISWSDDDHWVYAIEDYAKDGGTRLTRIDAAGSGANQFIARFPLEIEVRAKVRGRQLFGISWHRSVDLWRATTDAVPALAVTPPRAPAPASPPRILSSLTNARFEAAVGERPTDWAGTGTVAPATACGQFAGCAILDASRSATLEQRIDATPFRGRRVVVSFDAAVADATLLGIVNSGLYQTTEIPTGKTILTASAWANHSFHALVEADASYIKLEFACQGKGRAFVANPSIALAP